MNILLCILGFMNPKMRVSMPILLIHQFQTMSHEKPYGCSTWRLNSKTLTTPLTSMGHNLHSTKFTSYKFISSFISRTKIKENDNVFVLRRKNIEKQLFNKCSDLCFVAEIK